MYHAVRYSIYLRVPNKIMQGILRLTLPSVAVFGQQTQVFAFANIKCEAYR